MCNIYTICISLIKNFSPQKLTPLYPLTPVTQGFSPDKKFKTKIQQAIQNSKSTIKNYPGGENGWFNLRPEIRAHTQSVGRAETVTEILTQNKQVFTEAGLDAEKKISQLQEKNSKVIVADANQEKLKADLRKATEIAVTVVEDSYKSASSVLDAMVGSLGKDNTLSKRLKQLRAQMSKEALRGKKEEPNK